METNLAQSNRQSVDLDDFLRFKVYRGFTQRGYPLKNEYRKRIEYELGIIRDMKFSSYFLIVANLCNWMENKDIFFVVRGSGCGSCVVWGLGISLPWLDPIELKLPFERFLNPDRVSNPDLDIDIEDTRREEVFDFTFDKYGKDRVAKIITFSTLGGRGVIKDVCRALNVPDYINVANKINSAIPKVKPAKIAECVAKSEYLRELKLAYPEVFEYADRVEGRDRQIGIHAAATVIAPQPLTKYMPMYFSGNPAERTGKEVFPTTQWDMYDVEKRGLLKMDYLGSDTLKVLRQTRNSINQYLQETGREARIEYGFRNIPLDCKKSWDMAAEGRTLCVFQIEKPFCQGYARRMDLRNQKNFMKLAVLISIIRPGMMDTGATELYLKRANGEEQPVPIHPKLKDFLAKNYGLLIFQEDVMAVSQIFCGYSMSKADTLRRVMGKKLKKEMDAIKPDFIESAIKTSDATREEAEYVWSQCETFSRYGFCQSHAAAYGAIAFMTLWCKANWPLPFMTHQINSESGNTDKQEGYNFKVSAYIEESRSIGLKVTPPCVKQSGYECTYSWPNTIRFGLSLIKNVGDGCVAKIIGGLNQASSLKEFILNSYRVIEVDTKSCPDPSIPGMESVPAGKEWRTYASLSKTDLEYLCYAGAFDVFSKDRDLILAELPYLTKFASKYHEQCCKVKNGKRTKIKPEEVYQAYQEYAMDPDDALVKRMTLEDRLAKEHDVTGCFLSESPFEPFRNIIAKYQTTTPDEIVSGDAPERTQLMCVVLITSYREVVVKNGRNKGNMMAFVDAIGTSGNITLTIFSDNLPKIKSAVRTVDEVRHNVDFGTIAKNKVYLFQIRREPDRMGFILSDARRLSNNNCGW